MSIAKTRYYEAPRDIIIPEAYRSPLLPLLGAIALKLIPAIPETCFAILQSIVFGLTLLMVYCIAFRLSPTSYKKLTGLCAATLFIFNPLLLQYSFQFSSEELFTLCLLFFISLSLLPTCWWQRLLLAASIVAATYTRPTALLLFPLLFTTDIYIIFQAWRKQQNSILKTRINASLITLMGAILFIAPWGIRNQILFDKFSPVTFLGGFNLLLGNSSENLAAYQSSNGKDFIHHQNTSWIQTIEHVKTMPAEFSAKPALQDQYLREQAYTEIRKMGLWNFSFLSAAKAWQFLRPYPLPGLHHPLLFWGLTLYNCILYIFASLGIWANRKRLKDFGGSLALLILCGLSAHSITHVYMRHRIPFLEPVLILLAGLAISAISTRIYKNLINKSEN